MQQDDPKISKDAVPTGTQTLLRGLGVVQAVASGARDLKEIARLIGTTRSVGNIAGVTGGALLAGFFGHPAANIQDLTTNCGAKLVRPAAMPIWKRACASLALRINQAQARYEHPHPNWIHGALRIPRSCSCRRTSGSVDPAWSASRKRRAAAV